LLPLVTTATLLVAELVAVWLLLVKLTG